MANSPASITGNYKWLTDSYNTGYGRIDTSNKPEENQPAAPNTPERKEGQPTIDDFVAEK
ncbi:MAG: hypothetical protein NTY99_03990 [DPANN group archaeon]|nr:hypothetical protein [DPANN group archaeon]